MSDLNQMSVSVVKGLVMDGVGKAKSGHPGGAMSSADFATILFSDYLNYDPSDADWLNRDRFILSAGHESMLLYSLMALQGFLPLDEVKQFRQWGSKTPGHPEVEFTGVDATSGPLGQGIAMAVGMAIAEEMLADKFGKDIFDHYTYVLCGDGDLQEPISIGAAQLAGHYALGKLIIFYDRNAIQISGGIDRADSTDVPALFRACGWHVIESDGHDHAALHSAIAAAKAESGKPTMIIGKTVMAKGAATVEGDHETHGAPLKPEEVQATKEKLGLDRDAEFQFPDHIVSHFRRRQADMKAARIAWDEKVSAKVGSNAKLKELWQSHFAANYDKLLDGYNFAGEAPMATRAAFGKVLAQLADDVPALCGGSADLEPSNNTAAFFKKTGDFNRNNRGGRNFAFGVREFPMGTLINGMALHGGLRTFGATFLVFSDYERGALRLSALQHLPVMHVFTHDSFYVGEDGPTHQPIEHIASLRAMPNMLVLRPADASETVAVMRIAVQQKSRPSCLILTRQNLPVLDAKAHKIDEGCSRGGYVFSDSNGEPDLILIASGSELHLAISAAAKLSGKKVRIVSMPCMELFAEQSEEYRNSVLPLSCRKRVAIEAGTTFGWDRYTGLDGMVIGIDRFGASAPAGVLEKEFGFTPDSVAARLESYLK